MLGIRNGMFYFFAQEQRIRNRVIDFPIHVIVQFSVFSIMHICVLFILRNTLFSIYCCNIHKNSLSDK